jgi:D-glycero-D-manno-heptose 1,7-bisphosphate phosphatase
VSRIRLLPGTTEAVRQLNRVGIPVIVATNQSGIAKGYFSEETLRAVNAEMLRQLAEGDARVDGLYVCTHHPREGSPPYLARCECRKPRPGLLRQAAGDLDLDLAASVMIGDKLSDVAAGHAAGAAGVLVLSGYGRGEWEHRPAGSRIAPDHVALDLRAAVEWAVARACRSVGAR